MAIFEIFTYLNIYLDASKITRTALKIRENSTRRVGQSKERHSFDIIIERVLVTHA